MWNMFYLLLTGAASAACNLGVFDHLSTPTPPPGGHGVVTGQASFDGMDVVGGNFSREFFTEPKAVIMQINRVPSDREV